MSVEIAGLQTRVTEIAPNAFITHVAVHTKIARAPSLPKSATDLLDELIINLARQPNNRNVIDFPERVFPNPNQVQQWLINIRFGDIFV